MLALVVAAGAARAQQWADEPTDGVSTPATPLAGEHDVLSAVARNPAGLRFLRGSHFGVLLHLDDEANAHTQGAGLGLYSGVGVSTPLGAMGFGFGLEFLRPPPDLFLPDPGQPTRLTLGYSLGLGERAAIGISYHHFYDDASHPLSDVTTWDVGFSARFGPRFAWGGVVRDIGAPNVAGAPVQRRWEGELAVRPWATDVFEAGLGGRVGEIRHDFDGWARMSVRVARGVYFKADVAYQHLHALTAPADRATEDRRELRATAGVEVSFGSFGMTMSGVAAFDDDQETRFVGGSLYLRLSGEQVEPVFGGTARIERIELMGAMGDRGLTNTLLALRAMRRDDDVVAVFVQIDGVGVGWAGAHELRDGLAALRASGKKVFAYLVAGTTMDYYIASAADRVYVDPAGGVRLAGFAGTILYFKGLFDMLGVRAHYERIAEYKGVPETFMLEGPTEPALRMRRELYDDLYDTIIGGIADGRGLSKARVRELIDNGPYTAGQLVGSELVDGIVDPDELGARLAADLGGYYPVGSAPPTRPDRWAHPKIAVIYLDGDIVSGKSVNIPLLGRRLAGGETIANAIAAARADPGIAAIVLRIDSPGGSALASEQIFREVFRTRGVKPIVCSLGNTAASGGYFAAAGCDVVFASETTITGSIGIFAGKFDGEALFRGLGLSWETFVRGQHADRESYFRPYTEQEKTQLAAQIRYFYDRFLAAVAKGRGMKPEEVDAVGRGRVWTGRQAKRHKLIDEFGGIDLALAYAKAKAGITEDTPTTVVYLPATGGGLLGRLLGLPLGAEPSETTTTALLGLPGGEALLQALPLSLWTDGGAPQARLPFAIVWE